MAKSPDAFRTISEVSAWLETPPHVLRFWESKFPQVKPVKRAGGRRYYRPEDIALLGGIKVLLHEQGMTIRGVQKMLREQGVRHVASLSAQVWTEDGGDGAVLDGDLDPDLDAVLDGEDPQEADDALNGVIVGPWAERQDGRETDVAEEDEARLATLDGLPAGTAFAGLDAAAGHLRHMTEGDAVPGAGSHGTAEAPTLIGSFLAGTMSRLAAEGGLGIHAAGGAGDFEPEGTTSDPVRVPPLPPGEPTLERALALLRRADPERLRLRGDRIAPLLQRLKALREGLPRRSA